MNSRRRRQGVLALLCLAFQATWAACPPTADDGSVLRMEGIELAWRPLLRDGRVLAADRIPMAEHFMLEAQICPGGAPTGITLARVDATMPEHRHGMNYRPRLVALGSGRYRIEGMMFHMAGRWQIEFELVREGREPLRLLHDVRIR